VTRLAKAFYSLGIAIGRCHWGDVIGEMSLGRCHWGDVIGEMSLGRCHWGEKKAPTRNQTDEVLFWGEVRKSEPGPEVTDKPLDQAGRAGFDRSLRQKHDRPEAVIGAIVFIKYK
jgi:hypothetical protein